MPIILANIFQKERSSLSCLDLQSSGIEDEEAEILANSLKQNNKLKCIYLAENNITERGWRAFLKLLNDASSIKSTYNSNHTLEIVTLPDEIKRIEIV